MNSVVAAENTMKNIPLSLIVAGDNPRKYFDQVEFDELCASVKANGVIQPILVRPASGGTFAIVAGERRYRAAVHVFGREIGEIPAVVKELSDEDADCLALVENTVRADMSVTEEAAAAKKVLDKANGDRDEASRVLGWPLSKLNRRLALLNLIPAVMTALNERRILVGHAELLAAISPENQATAIETIIEKGVKVEDVKNFLLKMSTDFSTAIFELTRCGTCQYNSSIQASLFSETIGREGSCTNADCFKARQKVKIDEIRFELAQEVPEARIIEVGDCGFVKLTVDGATGVGAEQFEACKACQKFGATVSNIPGSVGVVERDVCFDADCNMKKVAERIKAQQQYKETPKTEMKGSTTHSPENVKQAARTKAKNGEKKTVAALSSKVIEYRRKEVWEKAAMKELVGQLDKAKAFALDIMLSGSGNLVNREKLQGFYKKIADSDYPDKAAYSDKKTGAPEAVYELNFDQQDKLFAAVGVATICSSEFKDDRLKKLLGFLETDLTKHFVLKQDFLALLTKSEIEVVCVSVGLDKAVPDFKKVMGGKKDEAIKAIFAAEFEFAGALPELLDYR